MALVCQTAVQDRPAAAQGQQNVPSCYGKDHPLMYHITENQQFCLMGVNFA